MIIYMPLKYLNIQKVFTLKKYIQGLSIYNLIKVATNYKTFLDITCQY